MSQAASSPAAASSGAPTSFLGFLGQIPGALNQAFAPQGGIQGVLGSLLQAGNPQAGAAGLGRAMIASQNNALNQALARQQLEQNQLALQRSLMMMPLMTAAIQQYLGGGDSSSAPASSDSADSNPSDSNPSAAPQAAQPLTAQQRALAALRLRAAASGAAAPGASPQGAIPGAAPPQAPPAAAPGLAPSAAGSAALPALRRQLLPTGAQPPGAPGATALGGGAAPFALPAQSAGADPLRQLSAAGALAMGGMPGASTLADLAKTRLQYSPQLATQMAAAKGQVAQDQLLLARAQQQGNPAMIRAMQTKLQTDTGQLLTNGMSGTMRIQNPDGSWTIVQPGSGLVTNTATGTRWLPGALQAEQQRAAAQARGAAQGELVDVVDPVTHQTYRVPKSSLLPGEPGAVGGGAGPGAADTSPAGRAGALGALSPGQQGYLEERGTESAKYVADLQDAADAATTTNYSLDQMLTASKNVQLGPGAAARQWIESGLATLGQQFGLNPPKELGSYEEMGKYGNQIAFAASRQLGSREAAQIVQLEIESNPNKQLVPEAFTGIVGSMKALNNYVIAKNTAIQAQSGTDADTALQAASAWTQHIDPRVWDLSFSAPLAAKFAGQIGIARIATAIPVMSNEDAIGVIRNLPMQFRAGVLARLPTAAKQQILAAMQQQTSGGP